MPFTKGNQLGKANLGRKKDHAKSLWLLESMNAQGFNFETKLITLLEKAIKGDKTALEAAHLMVKMLPHIANQPKNDNAQVSIDQLIINRYALPPSIDTDATSATTEGGNPPL